MAFFEQLSHAARLCALVWVTPFIVFGLVVSTKKIFDVAALTEEQVTDWVQTCSTMGASGFFCTLAEVMRSCAAVVEHIQWTHVRDYILSTSLSISIAWIVLRERHFFIGVCILYIFGSLPIHMMPVINVMYDCFILPLFPSSNVTLIFTTTCPRALDELLNYTS